MTNDIDILKMAITEYDKTVKIKKMSKRVFEQLTGSLCYICKYTEKHNIPIPEKELVYDLLTKCVKTCFMICLKVLENHQRNSNNGIKHPMTRHNQVIYNGFLLPFLNIPKTTPKE